MWFSDEVCGVYTEQQHHWWPLSGVCQSEGAVTPSLYTRPAQLAHRLPYLCCLPSCSWCLQVYTGEIKYRSSLCFSLWFAVLRMKQSPPLFPTRPFLMSPRCSRRVFASWTVSWLPWSLSIALLRCPGDLSCSESWPMPAMSPMLHCQPVLHHSYMLLPQRMPTFWCLSIHAG